MFQCYRMFLHLVILNTLQYTHLKNQLLQIFNILILDDSLHDYHMFSDLRPNWFLCHVTYSWSLQACLVG